MRQSTTGASLFARAMLLTALLASGCDGGTDPPPKPTMLVLVTEPSAAAQTMVPLGTQPVVQATAANGKAAPTATTVTAEVMDGRGAVAAGASATTDARGRATFADLTLGAAGGLVGSLTLRFSAPGLEPVTAAVELRCAVLPLAIGQTVNRALTMGDCAFSSGAFQNLFEVTTSQPVTAVQLTQEGAFAPLLNVRGANEPAYYWGWGTRDESRISFKALLPPGRNQVAVTSADPGRTGSYTLTVAAAPEDLTCDFPDAWAASPITTAQQLGAGDCSSGSIYADFVLVGLPRDASITASMTSGSFQPLIKLAEAVTNATAASATAPGTASITFTNGGAPTAYYLALSTDGSGGTGPYTLSVNITYPAGGVAAAARLPSSNARVLARGGGPRMSGPLVPGWSRSRP